MYQTNDEIQQCNLKESKNLQNLIITKYTITSLKFCAGMYFYMYYKW